MSIYTLQQLASSDLEEALKGGLYKWGSKENMPELVRRIFEAAETELQKRRTHGQT